MKERSSCSEMFCKKGIPRSFTTFLRTPRTLHDIPGHAGNQIYFYLLI